MFTNEQMTKFMESFVGMFVRSQEGQQLALTIDNGILDYLNRQGLYDRYRKEFFSSSQQGKELEAKFNESLMSFITHLAENQTGANNGS